jgi:23S rRNA (uridine2552-2'-O)-methyltransferase
MLKIESKESKIWKKKYKNDLYFKKAKYEGYRSRSAYKLIEIQKKYRLFQRGMSIIELGCSPGGWSQVLSRYIGRMGTIISNDILYMQPITRIKFIQGDFTNKIIYEQLISEMEKKTVDWVISDISPKITGNSIKDQKNTTVIVELILKKFHKKIEKNGGLIVKAFQGKFFYECVSYIKKYFNKVTINKPQASNKNSKEIYIIAINKK